MRQLRWVLLLALLAGCQDRASYPQRPVTLICPWSPGGGSDQIARQIAVQLERELRVPVNVVNATGGGGVTGHTRGALARPDGYNITLVTVELSMLHWRGLTSISYKDYEPLALINRDSAALFVRHDAPWNSLGELAVAIDQRPGKLKASGTAYGGIWHVALAGWLIHSGREAGAVTWVSINGAAPSLQELLAGGVEMVCCSVPEAQSLVDAGQVRCLAVMADERVTAVANAPTVRELGVDWTMEAWRGLAAPLDVPTERLAVLQTAVQRAATNEDFLGFLRTAGFGAEYLAAGAFASELAGSDRQFGEMFSSAALQSVKHPAFDAMVFPALLGGGGFLVLAVLLLSGGLRQSAGAAPVTRAGLGRVALVPLWIALYLVLADTVGFLLVAAGLTLGMFVLLRVRTSVAAGVTVVLVPAVYQLFAVYLRVPLPWGWWGW